MTADESLDGVLGGEYAYTRYIPRERLAGLLASAELRSRVQRFTLPQCVYLLMNADAGRLARRARAAPSRTRSTAPGLSTVQHGARRRRRRGDDPAELPRARPRLRGPAYDPELAIRLLDESGYDRARPVDFVSTEASWLARHRGGRARGRRPRARRASRSSRCGRRLTRTRRASSGRSTWSRRTGSATTSTPTRSPSARSTRRSALSTACTTRAELDALMQRRALDDRPRAARRALPRRAGLFQEICPALVLLHRREYVIHAAGVEGVQLYPQLPPFARATSG